MIFIHIYGSPRLVYVIVGLYCDTQTLNLMYLRWVPDNLEPPLLQYLYLRSFRLFEPCSRRAISQNDGQLFYMFSVKKNTKKCMLLCETDFTTLYFIPSAFVELFILLHYMIDYSLALWFAYIEQFRSKRRFMKLNVNITFLFFS